MHWNTSDNHAHSSSSINQLLSSTRCSINLTPYNLQAVPVWGHFSCIITLKIGSIMPMSISPPATRSLSLLCHLLQPHVSCCFVEYTARTEWIGHWLPNLTTIMLWLSFAFSFSTTRIEENLNSPISDLSTTQSLFLTEFFCALLYDHLHSLLDCWWMICEQLSLGHSGRFGRSSSPLGIHVGSIHPWYIVNERISTHQLPHSLCRDILHL